MFHTKKLKLNIKLPAWPHSTWKTDPFHSSRWKRPLSRHSAAEWRHTWPQKSQTCTQEGIWASQHRPYSLRGVWHPFRLNQWGATINRGRGYTSFCQLWSRQCENAVFNCDTSLSTVNIFSHKASIHSSIPFQSLLNLHSGVCYSLDKSAVCRV